MFLSGCAVFKVQSGIFRSLKTIQIQEDERHFGRLFAGLFCFPEAFALRFRFVSTSGQALRFRFTLSP